MNETGSFLNHAHCLTIQSEVVSFSTEHLCFKVLCILSVSGEEIKCAVDTDVIAVNEMMVRGAANYHSGITAHHKAEIRPIDVMCLPKADLGLRSENYDQLRLLVGRAGKCGIALEQAIDPRADFCRLFLFRQPLHRGQKPRQNVLQM